MGKLTVKYSRIPTGPWKYQLMESVQPGSQNDGPEENNATDSVTIQVLDKNGNTHEVVVNVTILDDAPVLEVQDTIETVESGATESSAEGKISFDFGADDTEGKGFTVSVEGKDVSTPFNENGSTAVVGKYGTLTINADGTYSYTANTNTEIAATLGSAFSENVTDKFTFTITDADGDTVSKTLDVTVSPAKTPEVSCSALVDEANLVDADEGNVTKVAEVTVADMFGQDSGYKIVGAQLPEGSSNSVSYEDGKLTYTLNGRTEGGKESIGLSDDESARQREDTTTGESILVTVEDAAGNQFTVEVPVEVIDDVPTISVLEPAFGAYGSTVTGSVAIDFGADGADGEKAVTVSLNGETVTGVKKDGNYTFTFDDDSTLTLDGSTGAFSYDGVPTSGTGTSYEFTFTVTDADGDTATATTTAEIAPKASYTGTVSSFDNDLLQESSPSHPVEVSGMPGIKEISDGAKVFQGETLIGEFTLSGGTLFFKQLKAYTHGDDSNSVTLPHQLTVTDEYGKEHIVAVDITIEDSDPYAHNDTFELKKRGEVGSMMPKATFLTMIRGVRTAPRLSQRWTGSPLPAAMTSQR